MREKQDDYFRELASKAYTSSEIAMTKIVDHERLCADRYKASMGWLKSTFFTLISTLLSAVGVLVFYLLTKHPQ